MLTWREFTEVEPVVARVGRSMLFGHDDAFCLTGTIVEHTDPSLRDALAAQFFADRNMDAPWPGFESETLVEYRIERVLLTLTRERDGLPSGHTIWPRRPDASSAPG